MEDLIEVQLSRVVIQEKGDCQYIHLQELGGERSFPIVIGFSEACEINRKLQDFDSERPLTHDLIGRILESLEVRLCRVVINELKNSTFYAMLVLAGGEEEKTIDCRPSDGIALAVQVGAPVFVHRKVFDLVAPA